MCGFVTLYEYLPNSFENKLLRGLYILFKLLTNFDYTLLIKCLIKYGNDFVDMVNYEVYVLSQVLPKTYNKIFTFLQTCFFLFK